MNDISDNFPKFLKQMISLRVLYFGTERSQEHQWGGDFLVNHGSSYIGAVFWHYPVEGAVRAISQLTNNDFLEKNAALISIGISSAVLHGVEIANTPMNVGSKTDFKDMAAGVAASLTYAALRGMFR